MPRKGKGQKIRTGSGDEQVFGEQKQQRDAQRQFPLAKARPVAAGRLDPDSFSRAVESAAAFTESPVGLLRAPSQRPDQPIQAGLSTGPGPGPQAIGIRDSALDTIEAIAVATGDPRMFEVLEAARLHRRR